MYTKYFGIRYGIWPQVWVCKPKHGIFLHSLCVRRMSFVHWPSCMHIAYIYILRVLVHFQISWEPVRPLFCLCLSSLSLSLCAYSVLCLCVCRMRYVVCVVHTHCAGHHHTVEDARLIPSVDDVAVIVVGPIWRRALRTRKERERERRNSRVTSNIFGCNIFVFLFYLHERNIAWCQRVLHRASM